jgi:hypothetical protein
VELPDADPGLFGHHGDRRARRGQAQQLKPEGINRLDGQPLGSPRLERGRGGRSHARQERSHAARRQQLLEIGRLIHQLVGRYSDNGRAGPAVEADGGVADRRHDPRPQHDPGPIGRALPITHRLIIAPRCGSMAAMSFRVTALDHVQLAMPAGREAEAEVFYGGVLGFEVLPKPPALAARGGRWFACGAVQIHLGVEEDFRAARKAHPALAVVGLDALVAALADDGTGVRWDEDVPGVRRCFVDDPFGNRIELIESGPAAGITEA